MKQDIAMVNEYIIPKHILDITKTLQEDQNFETPKMAFSFRGPTGTGKTAPKDSINTMPLIRFHPAIGKLAKTIAAFTGIEEVNGHTLPAFVKGTTNELILTKNQYKKINECFFL